MAYDVRLHAVNSWLFSLLTVSIGLVAKKSDLRGIIRQLPVN